MTLSQNDASLLEKLEKTLAAARRQGASQADAMILRSQSLAVAQRLGAREKLERSESQDLGLRVLVGKQQAIVSTTDLSPAALDALVERAVAMARAAPEDKFLGLADIGQTGIAAAELDLFDPVEPSVETLTARAAQCEDAARAIDGVSNSEGAEAQWSQTEFFFATSTGFQGSYRATGHALSASVLAGSGTAMERDYDYSHAAHASDLTDPTIIGQNAGRRAVRRLHPRPAQSGKFPVIFERRVASMILRALAGAINGAAIARGTSFLQKSMGQQIFPTAINIQDDPLRRRGQRSRLFDAEGFAATPRRLIDQGVLTSWVLDLRTSRQLGLASTGNAARHPSSPPYPSVSNLFIAPGRLSLEEMARDIGQGFLATELLGHGVNDVTGDYSQGAAGFWIDHGEIAFPVSGITLAGNMKDIFADLVAANDLEFKTGIDAPSLRTESLTVAGG
ncbi:MAG: TldD/PmbA family protein [Candidatus Symbiobacter sp.]|nr:TldD/PmbA family protein [Candidatus Symbiobacter sp.]